MVSIFGIYFEWVREHVSLFYTQMDPSKLDFRKNVCNGQQVDDEEVSLLETQSSSPSKDGLDVDLVMEGSRHEAPCLEDSSQKM